MTMLLKTWTPEDVQNAKDQTRAFCEYTQQTLGVPYPTGKDIATVRKKANDFFKMYPHCDWYTMCRIVLWCKARKRRPARMHMVIDNFRFAWSQGFLPELNTPKPDVDLETEIGAALQVETREGWRRRLIMAQGPEIRRKVYAEWKNDRLSLSGSQ